MKILIATGGSPHSLTALQFGLQIVRQSLDTPTILTVVKREADRARAKDVLDSAVNVLNKAAPEVTCIVRVGQAAEQILAEASEGGYELVIVGERENHGLVTKMLGSTAIQVVEHAPCSVILVKGQVGPIRRILLCDSGGLMPDLLTRFVLRMRERMTANEDVTVLHVMSQITAATGVPDDQLFADADELIEVRSPEGELLERDLELLQAPGVRPNAKVRHGSVVEEILAEAHQGDYDLVVIGAHRDQGWQRWLLADITHQVITHLGRPVLVVR